ncbi:MAG: hypothetical protein ACHQ49_00570 [Elusimicrobiota bacterium]
MLKTPSRKPVAHHAKTHRPSAVRLNYPRPGEKVSRPSYSVQIETPPEPVRVELRINDSDWIPCREAVGLWWYDWAGYEPGGHRLTARVVTQDGEISESIEREIIVV